MYIFVLYNKALFPFYGHFVPKYQLSIFASEFHHFINNMRDIDPFMNVLAATQLFK